MYLKLKEWIKRYWFAELIALITALSVSYITFKLFHNFIISAFITTWVENLLFYSIIAYNDLKRKNKRNQKLFLKDYLIQFKNMIIEFGPAEYFDSFLIRPFCLSLFPYLISNYTLAIFIGSMLANVTYYFFVILSYESRKKIFKED